MAWLHYCNIIVITIFWISYHIISYPIIISYISLSYLIIISYHIISHYHVISHIWFHGFPAEWNVLTEPAANPIQSSQLFSTLACQYLKDKRKFKNIRKYQKIFENPLLNTCLHVNILKILRISKKYVKLLFK